MAKRGRPIAMDDVNKNTFLALTTFGLKLDEAADRIGFAPVTVRRALGSDAKFKTDYRNARFRSVAKVLETLHAAARENWKAATWYAERVLPEHFAKRSPRHITLETANSMYREVLREVRSVLPRGESRRLAMRRLSRLAILWDRDLRPGGSLRRRRRAPKRSDQKRTKMN